MLRTSYKVLHEASFIENQKGILPRILMFGL